MKSALVIGGTSGIGKVIADILTESHIVTSVGRKEWNFIKDPCPYDIGTFDIVVFSAGVETGGNQNFVIQSTDDIDQILQTNLVKQIHWSRVYCEQRQGPGHVVFVGSAHSMEKVSPHKLMYCVSRIAIREYILGARRELAEIKPDITFSLLRPGCTRTNFYRNKWHGNVTEEQEEAYYKSMEPYMSVDDIRPYMEGILNGSLKYAQEIIFSAVPT
jgi:short-subunit dehydrogenase